MAEEVRKTVPAEAVGFFSEDLRDFTF